MQFYFGMVGAGMATVATVATIAWQLMPIYDCGQDCYCGGDEEADREAQSPLLIAYRVKPNPEASSRAKEKPDNGETTAGDE